MVSYQPPHSQRPKRHNNNDLQPRPATTTHSSSSPARPGATAAASTGQAKSCAPPYPSTSITKTNLTKRTQIERTTNSTLEEYMQTHIWSKLGAQSTTFHPERATHLPPLVPMKHRTGNTTTPTEKRPLVLVQPAQHALGGVGLFSTPTDFSKLLVSLLQSSTSTRQGPTTITATKTAPELLTKPGIDLLFRPQLDASCRAAMPRPLGAQMRRVLNIQDINDTTQADHALGGTVTLRDIPGRRRRGSMNWSGLPNLHWVCLSPQPLISANTLNPNPNPNSRQWIDPASGIAAALFTQIMPPVDASVTDLLLELERALYRAVAVGAEAEAGAGTEANKCKTSSPSGGADAGTGNMAKL